MKPVRPSRATPASTPTKNSIHVAVVSAFGRDLDDREFPTTADGYHGALAFIASHGETISIGIEGTSSCCVGITRAVMGSHRKAPVKDGTIDGNRPLHNA